MSTPDEKIERLMVRGLDGELTDDERAKIDELMQVFTRYSD